MMFKIYRNSFLFSFFIIFIIFLCYFDSFKTFKKFALIRANKFQLAFAGPISNSMFCLQICLPQDCNARVSSLGVLAY
ncbi:hypothetical protein L1887_03284 [Cichorium endivia]|nr:hypothetical protein L1887_03284 [Cichorium endivia]